MPNVAMAISTYCRLLGFLAILSLYGTRCHGFVSSEAKIGQRHSIDAPTWSSSSAKLHLCSLHMIKNPFQSFLDVLPSAPKLSIDRPCQARDLVSSLVTESNSFSTETGAVAFGDACAADVVYEDCYESKPFVGKEVR
jgi:hypothetical protein